MRARSKQKGSSEKKIAEEYLKKEGYDILARNFRTQPGEIDLVASLGKFLVFVKVKAADSENSDSPLRFLIEEQRKISMVASQYIKLNMYFGAAVRFDVIEVCLADGRINHIIDAFDSYLKY